LKKILVIEDDPGIQEAIKAILEFSNFTVETADNIDYLEKILIENPPSLVILDLMLASKSTLIGVKKIKQNSQTKHIPIIMLSAHPQASQSAKEAGANDFLAKPFNMDELLDKINKLI
jgi:DNA-binding response OmpR family regulator